MKWWPKARLISLLFAFVGGCLIALPTTWADEPSDLVESGKADRYKGIIPGERDDLPGLAGAPLQGANVLTWVGFVPEPQRSRVFVQTATPTRYSVAYGTNSLIITVEGVSISRSNFRRFIDTSYFDRSVTRIESRQTSNDVEITITARSPDQVEVSTEDRYLFFDFPEETDQDSPMVSDEPPHQASDEIASADRSPPEVAPPSTAADDSLETDSLDADPFEDSVDESRRADRADDEDDRIGDPEEDQSVRPLGEARQDPEVASRSWPLPVALGGLAVAGAGGGLHLWARSQRSTVLSVPIDEVVPITQREAAELENRTNTMDTVALGLVIGGGLATAIGITGFLLPDRGSPTSGTALSFRSNSDHFRIDLTVPF